MRRRYGFLILAGLASILIVVLAACDGDDTADTTTSTTGGTAATTTTTAMPDEPTIAVPFLAQWQASGHNDVDAEAFVHWDEDDPAVIPAACARCHSEPGYLDYIGADGTAAGVVDAETHPIGTTVNCATCHNAVTLEMTSVVMPSGIELTGLGDESRCMQCHQGRHSTVSVNEAIGELPEDEVSEDLGFLNIHYYAAAATKYGTAAKGGYEYEGKTYDAFFMHVEGYEVCQDCHNPHTLELKIDECATCHTGVSSVEDLAAVRMPGSLVDYDGDGDLTEGVSAEMAGLQEKLYEAMQAYAADVAGSGIVYDGASYPYFFDDAGERYASWTPRLLRAAYNYQVSLKDPGTFAHGGKYIIQLVYDSIEDLGTVSMDGMHRIDHGHFAGSEEAFRHWDEDDPAVVPASCARCHTATGLPTYLAEGVTITAEPANGFLCSTCHNDLGTYSIREAETVSFPSGATVSLEEDVTSPQMQLCISCHQGRESTVSVDRLIGDKPADSPDAALRFLNIHYFAAGATVFGTDVQGGYEYAGQTYVGRFEHVNGFNTCTDCHDTHALEVKYEACSSCHPSVETVDDLQTIRISTDDFDGDGDATEGIYEEVVTMKEALLAALQAYADDTGLDAIVYDSGAYPYYFIDTDGSGTADPGEANFGNRYVNWTPRLLRAAYNYQYASKDPGGFAHNGKYVLQLLYDSLADIGGSTAGMTRAS